MRKLVKPADAGASIPDPVRRTDLPSGWSEVEWSVHWARLEARGDIKVKNVPEEDEAKADAKPPKQIAADADAGKNPQADSAKAVSSAPSARATNP